MLRRDVDEAVVAASAHTPFEASFRVFVLERADTMNDEAANALLKTLEEPPELRRAAAADRPADAGAADDRVALPAGALRPAGAGGAGRAAAGARRRAGAGRGRGAAEPRRRRARARARGRRRRRAARARRGVRARAAARPHRRRAARGSRCSSSRPRAARRRARRTRSGSRRSCSSSRARSTSGARPRSASRRAAPSAARQTAALDHGLQLAGLWYRDLACVAAGAPELAHHADRAQELAEDAEGRSLATLREAAELVDDFRARLALNVSYDLACEALAFRLERLLR